jgi:hypothetical protein
LIELRIVDRLVEVRAAEVDRHLVAARQQRHVEHLRVDGEAERPELDDRSPVLEQLEPVPQRPQRVLPRADDLRRDLVGLDRRPQPHQLLDQLLRLQHHRVGREVGVELLRRLERLGPPRHPLEDPVRRDHQRLDPRLPLVEQRLLAGRQRVVHLLALRRQVAEELVELREPPRQLLELDQQLGQLLVALLRRVRLRQRRRDRLREQLELRRELRLALARQQLLAHALIRRAHPAEVGEHRRDVLEDLRARHRVADLQPADHLGQHVEPVAQRRDLLLDRHQLSRVVDLVEPRQHPVEAPRHRLQRVALDQEVDARLADAVELRDQLLLEHIERRQVDRPDLAQRDDRAPLVAQGRQRVHVLLDALPVARPQRLNQRRLLGLRVRQRLAGPLADRHDLLELVDDELAGLPDRPERAPEVARLRLADPVVVVGHPRRLRDQVLVRLAPRVRVLGQPHHAQRLRDAAHQLRVADLRQVRPVRRGRRRELGAHERRAPHLHRVQPRRLLALHAEHHQLAVREQRVAVALDRVLHLLADQVVREQHVLALIAAIEHIQHVLAVRRVDAPLELEGERVRAELLRVAGPQVVPAREHHAVVLGQLHAALPDRVDPRHRLGPRVVDEVPPLRLAVRLDLQQHQRAHDAVQDLRVVERLVGVLDRLAVDAEPVLRVVLDLDRQIAADRLDEHQVLDVDVRVLPRDVIVARRGRPREVVRRRPGELAVAAAVDVAHPAARQHVPVEDLDVLDRRADLEHREQLVLRGLQAGQPRVLVILVEVRELLHEPLAVEQPGDRTRRRRVDRLALRRRRVERLRREHVLDRDLFLEPEEHVVAEQQDARRPAGCRPGCSCSRSAPARWRRPPARSRRTPSCAGR